MVKPRCPEMEQVKRRFFISDYPHSYQPLFDTLDKLGYSLEDLQKKARLADSTILKISWGKPIMISSICKIAILLGVDITDIVAPDYTWDPNPPQKPNS